MYGNLAKTIVEPVEFKYKAALYIRLSSEDGDKQESNSVTSQRKILSKYVEGLPDTEIYDYYIDDGYSGTSFDRPAFKKMMEAIYAGNVNCIIVKDLSRFGRNYSKTGYYLDEIYRPMRIRFIAINNSIDTFSANTNSMTECISVGMTNVMNEVYAASTSVSVKNTLSVYRSEGKFVGSHSVYGYKKDPENKHQLIIDEEAAEVVRWIFEKFVSGTSITGIVRSLNKRGVPNPSRYKALKGVKPDKFGNDGLWCERTVRRFLENRTFIGDMVQGKHEKLSYKSKKIVPVDKQDWCVVEGTHEPIIDKKTFDKAQSLFNQHIYTNNKQGKVGLFSGFLRCAECGAAMRKKTNYSGTKTYVYYLCGTFTKKNKDLCTAHRIREDRLEKAVLTAIKTFVKASVNMAELIKTRSENKSTDSFVKELKKAREKLEQYDNMSFSLYKDFKTGVISKAEYASFQKKIPELQEQLRLEIAELEKTIDEYDNAKERAFSLDELEEYLGLRRLNRKILLELVDKIYIHENNEITIDFKFKNEFNMAKDYLKAE